MKIWKIAEACSGICPKCKQVLKLDEIGDAYCRTCNMRVTFGSGGFVIGTKPLEWTEEDWNSKGANELV